MAKSRKNNGFYIQINLPDRFSESMCVDEYLPGKSNIWQFLRLLKVGEKITITKLKDVQVASRIRSGKLREMELE